MQTFHSFIKSHLPGHYLLFQWFSFQSILIQFGKSSNLTKRKRYVAPVNIYAVNNEDLLNVYKQINKFDFKSLSSAVNYHNLFNQ